MWETLRKEEVLIKLKTSKKEGLSKEEAMNLEMADSWLLYPIITAQKNG